MESSTNFLQILKSQFGSTEEFGQFERDFYSQKEEVAMLRVSKNKHLNLIWRFDIFYSS